MRVLKSLMRGLRALDHMAACTDGVRLTDLAVMLGVDKSNASHIVRTLEAAGYVVQDETKRYSVTGKVGRSDGGGGALATVVHVKELWHGVLEELVAVTGECAHLAVLVEQRVWYIDKVDSPFPLKVDHPIGALSPLHCTALGKAFLAFGPAVIAADLARYTRKTVTSLEELRRQIEVARATGYTRDDEEFAEGVRCVAIPVYDASRMMIAALGISGPSVRIDDVRITELGETVKSVASAYS